MSAVSKRCDICNVGPSNIAKFGALILFDFSCWVTAFKWVTIQDSNVLLVVGSWLMRFDSSRSCWPTGIDATSSNRVVKSVVKMGSGSSLQKMIIFFDSVVPMNFFQLTWEIISEVNMRSWHHNRSNCLTPCCCKSFSNVELSFWLHPLYKFDRSINHAPVDSRYNLELPVAVAHCHGTDFFGLIILKTHRIWVGHLDSEQKWKLSHDSEFWAKFNIPPSSSASSLTLDCLDFLSFFSLSFDFSFFSFLSLSFSFFLSLTSLRSFSLTSTFSRDFSRFSLLFVGNLNAFDFFVDFDGLLVQNDTQHDASDRYCEWILLTLYPSPLLVNSHHLGSRSPCPFYLFYLSVVPKEFPFC